VIKGCGTLGKINKPILFVNHLNLIGEVTFYKKNSCICCFLFFSSLLSLSFIYFSIPMSVNLTELVKRPGAGKVGKPVRVRANFFEVTNFTNGNIHHYDVTLDPPSTPPAVQRKVWKTFEDTDGQGILKGIKTVYDGRKNVFSPKPLPLGEDNAMQFEVIYHLLALFKEEEKKFLF
jgi:hypothetical protein